jgi:hypothetical protein
MLRLKSINLKKNKNEHALTFKIDYPGHEPKANQIETEP